MISVGDFFPSPVFGLAVTDGCRLLVWFLGSPVSGAARVVTLGLVLFCRWF